MSILAYLLGASLLVWSMMPLFKKDSSWISLYMELEELEDRKQRVYGNIADLEFDYAMGRLSESDFTEVRQSFMNDAGRVIQKLEDQRSADLEERVKQDIKNIGKKSGSKKIKHQFCGKCGSENSLDAKFCTKCGEGLS